MNLNPFRRFFRGAPPPAPASAALAPPERRASLENPNVPVTAEQLAMLLGGEPTRSGVTVNEQTALTYTAVYAAIRILAESVGMLPLVVYSGDADVAAGAKRSRATWHPAYRLLLQQPNADMSAAVFKETLQGHLGAWGNAYARIVWNNGGNVKELLPLLPNITHPERVAGQLRYTVEKGGSFAPEEILHVPGLGFNGLMGYSPIGMAREAIALGKAAEFFGASFFGNGARVSGVLTSPNVLKPEHKAGIREAWQQMHAGVSNVGKTALLDGGLAYTQVGIPPEDAQFLETRKFQVTEIARLFRIPPHMLADLERATFSNIEHQSIEFLVFTLSPWLEKWEQEVNRKLFNPGSGFFVDFDERRLTKADHAARKDYYATARQWGWMNVNDIRAEEGLNPIGKEGDIYLSPSNMVKADQVGQVPPAPAGGSAGGNAGGMGGDTGAGNTPRPTGQGGKRDRLAFTPVFADAIGRMLRKESNARSRGKADEKFYAEHRGHVIEALTPAAEALARVAGRELNDGAAAAIAAFAEQRNDAVIQPAAAAEALARQIAEAIETEPKA